MRKKTYTSNHPAYDYYDVKLTNVTIRSETQKEDIIFLSIRACVFSYFF